MTSDRQDIIPPFVWPEKDVRQDEHRILDPSPGRKRKPIIRCVLNRTLIDRKTNIRISDRAPGVYMRSIEQALGETKFDELLDSHLLPSNSESALWHNDFDAFLNWRQEALWQEIKSVTGAVSATDLLSEDTVDVERIVNE
jgi:hypothetical protein